MSEYTAEFKQEFGVYVRFACEDSAVTLQLVQAAAGLQVKEEPRAPRFALLGVPTPTTEGYPPVPKQLTKGRLFWVAYFESQDAYDTDHKNRESNKAFSEQLMASGFNKENPMMNMTGSYTGPMLHLERPGAALANNLLSTYTIVVHAVAEDAASAASIVEINKAHALKQLAVEEGMLRYTIFRPRDGVMPGPKDELTVTWVEAWRTASDHTAHKRTAHVAATNAQLQNLTTSCTVVEFAQTQHFN